MATRNRTVIFRKYRDALKSVRIPVSGTLQSEWPSTSAGGGPVIELVSTSFLNSNRSYAPLSTEDPGNSRGVIRMGLPPAWVDVAEEIGANTQRARTKMTELAKAHSKALMPTFGDGREVQQAIETLTHDITTLIRKSEKNLRKLSMDGPSADSNIRKNVQRSLATDLQNISTDLRKKQSTYLKRLKQQGEGQDDIDLEMNLNGRRSAMDDDNLDDMVFTEHQMTKLRKKEAFTEEREREINQVAMSVNELAQIMKDLSVLVIDQGTIVDRIDYNIQNVRTTVVEGLKQLQKAERTQKEGRMVKCVTVLVIMCLVMMVLLILKEALL